jgi:hypothetical protein
MIAKKTHISMYQERIFQHLSKPEAVLEIKKSSSIRSINILQFSKSATSTSSCVDGDKSVPGPVAILLVTSEAVGVVEGLENFWAENVVSVGDVETGFLVEGKLVGWDGRIVGVAGESAVFNPLGGKLVKCLIRSGERGSYVEDFRSNACKGAVVGVFATFYQSQTKIDVLFILKNEAAEQEVSSVEASH